MEKNRVTPADAAAYASAGGLAPHKVPSLDNAKTTGGKQ
jgi:hypothetical protein